MNNYEFCAQWVLDQNPEPTARVLDYGCGAGEIVTELRKRSLNAFGCDVYYDGGDYSKLMGGELFVIGFIKRMHENVIPFDDAWFDLIVSNQVFEHVESLDSALAEIHRVLKPGGKLLCLFPHQGIWREGHCGIPFLHWFKKKSRLRVYYAAIFRTLGFGYYKDGKSIMTWSQEFCNWLDQWTHYRTKQEVSLAFSERFKSTQPIEDYWLQQRIGSRKSWANWLPVSVQRFVVNKLCGLIFVVHKSS